MVDDEVWYLTSGRRIGAAALMLSFVALTSGLAAPAASAQSGVQVMRSLVYGEDRGQRLKLDAYVPETAGTERPAVVFVHGGGWFRGGKSLFRNEATQIAQMGWVTFSIDYDLDPPRWPAELNDVMMAVKWVRDNAARFGVDPTSIGLVGSSAGGNLAALAGVWGEGSNTTGSRVRVVVSWSGPMDLTELITQPEGPPGSCSFTLCAKRAETIPPRVQDYIGCQLQSCPGDYRDASPITHVDPTDPPMLIANGSEEVIPFNQAQAMHDTLDGSGVPNELVSVPGRKHARQYSAFIMPRTVSFLAQWISGRPRSGNGAGASIPWLPIASVVVVLLIIGLALLFTRRRSLIH